MKILKLPEEVTALTRNWKRAGEKIALVPTMGCLHEGHLSLVRQACKLGSVTVVTIFVNPMQFGPNEDFANYPRQLEKDCSLLEAEGVDLVFCPEPTVMYSDGFQTNIRVNELSKPMCGASRPGHFDGVATVVTKLFNITQPDYALFGEKDFQQLTIIKRLVRDLNFDIEIVGCPIVREEDGLALSSRNKYLTPETRVQALCLSRALRSAVQKVSANGPGLSAAKLLTETRQIIEEGGGVVDYIVIVDESSLSPVETIAYGSVMALAVKIAGTVRLIDNAKLL